MTALGVIALLVGMLLPGLSRARKQARAAVCSSNLRQLLTANDQYTLDSGGYYCPGAAGFLENLHRWHGSRNTLTEPFDPRGGPLAPFLGEGAAVRRCPSFSPENPGFEAGNGGYGYNNAYLGVQTASIDDTRVTVKTDASGALAHRVTRPDRTIMFTDAAFVSGGLIEYSFAEPRFHPGFGSRADPSIHFRHRKTANVGWCDGHVSAERRSFTWSSGFYEGDPNRHDVGWPGRADDNRLFDLQ